MTRARTGRCERCGEDIVFVLVIPEVATAGTRRHYVPLDAEFDPTTSAVPPSHALSAGRTTCRVITADRPLVSYEHPAMTHFATCTARQRNRTEVPA